MMFGELLVGAKFVKIIENSNDLIHNSITIHPPLFPRIPNRSPKPVPREKSNLKLLLLLLRSISKRSTPSLHLQVVQTADLSRLLQLLIHQPISAFVLLAIIPFKLPILQPSQSIFPHRWSDEVVFPADVP